MPELPEVETVKETLKKIIVGKKITNIKINYDNIIEYPTVEEFKRKIINKIIVDMKRRGKWLIFDLKDYYLLSHLRMEGRYFYKSINDSHQKHEHVIFELDSKDELRYIDARKFGRMHLINKEMVNDVKPLNELGLEPWDNNLNISYLKEKYKNKKLPIKTVILDQSIIVGIGNIYADEILFLCKINPQKRANELKDIELENIIKYTKEVLSLAIENGGTTIRSYESSEGVHGRFQQNLLVHNHEKDLCTICNHEIIKIRVGGRGTYFCPQCQR